jgi:geranylgeranyl pyrophosphate synthase
MIIHEKDKNNSMTNAVPQHPEKLKKIRELIHDYAVDQEMIPPLQEEEVIYHATQLIQKHPELFLYQKLLAVMINNYAWQKIVAGIPYNKRILLLPKCMSHSTACPAKYDELGLLCEQCGRCELAEVIQQADDLGYFTIVSEGTTSASALLSSGTLECVIGVGCLHSFERSFPLAVKEAVPSIAIPLYNNDCKDSKIDRIWLSEVLSLRSENSWNGWINLDHLKGSVKDWFQRENLQKHFEPNADESVQIISDWMAVDGKRWRPLIMMAVYQTLQEDQKIESESLERLAISIECFHKASLIHDDIADEDQYRYGKETLHTQYNVPVAINLGDLLLGYGYQLIADAHVKSTRKLLRIAAQGHRDLSLGQGEELLWRKQQKILSEEEIYKIFSLKTSPAFDVALQFGAVLAGADQNLLKVLSQYSKALGIAYQIKDDLEDFRGEELVSGFNTLQPSLIAAILNRKYPEKMKNWKNSAGEFNQEIMKWKETKEAIQEAEKQLQHYKKQALFALQGVKQAALKILLIRLLGKIIK